MPSALRLICAAALAALALPATASAALTKVADSINVAPDAPSPLSQFYPDVAMAADGSFAVSYSEQDDTVGSTSERVWVQRFTASMAKVGGPIAVTAAGVRSTFPAIAMAPDGRFAVIYDTATAPNHHFEIQRFSAAGSPVGAPILPDDANTDNSGDPPAIAMADDGRFAVAWIGGGLRARSYAADGTPQTAVQQLGADIQHSPSIGMAGDGHYVVTAVQPSTLNPDFVTFSDELVPGWRFHADGTPDGVRQSLFTGPAGVNYATTAIGMADSGQSFLAFADRHGPAPGEYESDVWARRFDAAGAPLGDRFIANDYTAYSQLNPDVEMDADGDTLLAYEGQVGTQQWGYVRQFGADGTPVGPGENLNSSSSGARLLPHIDSDGSGRMAYAWVAGAGGGPNTSNVYVGRWNYAAVTDPPAPAPSGGGDPAPVGGAPIAPPAAAVVPAAQPKPVAAASTTKVADVVTFPAATSCASRRRFAIRLRVPKGSDVTQATVKVNGKTVAVRKGARLRSTVDLRNLPKGRFTVSIALKLANGKTVKGERKYRTCTLKRKGGKPKV